MSMVLLKDLSRTARGVSLVTKEIARRSEAAEAPGTGEFQSLVKMALVAATNFSGLTIGKVREYGYSNSLSSSSSSSSSTSESSVVYFENEPVAVPDMSPPPSVSPTGSAEAVSEALVQETPSAPEMIAQVETLYAPGSQSSMEEAVGSRSPSPSSRGNAVEAPAPLKRRRPRERKVPSTPFKRKT